MRSVRLQMQADVNPPDYQHAFIELNFADGFGNQPAIRGRNVARLQRASKRSGESTCGGCDDIVQGRGMFLERAGRQLIVLRHRAVDAKSHRFALHRQPGPANGPAHSLDADLRSVHNVTHGLLL
jgi:hypothetical protein